MKNHPQQGLRGKVNGGVGGFSYGVERETERKNLLIAERVRESDERKWWSEQRGTIRWHK